MIIGVGSTLGKCALKFRLSSQIFFIVLFSILATESVRAQNSKNSDCTYIAKIPHATLQNCMGQNILILEGTSTEMAKAHGNIFKNYLSPDVSRYFSRKVDESVNFLPSVFKSMAQYLLSTVSSKLRRNMPENYSSDLLEFSMGAQISYDELSKALAAPDLASLGYSYANSSFKIPWFGCTSLGQIKDENLVFGRNLDFDGTDQLDQHSLLVVHKPTDKSELKRAAFVADGIHFSGISAFNEEGLAVFVHQNFSSENSIRALPIMLLTDWMLKSSRDIDEAISFLKDHRPGPMWTMVLVDTKRKKIKTVEASYSVFGVREAQPLKGSDRTDFVQTNHLFTPEAQKTQLISYPLLRNSQMRYQKGLQSLAEMKGTPSVEAIRDVLSYQKTLRNSEPSLYDDVAKPSTVHTVLLEAKKGQEPEIWLSRSLAPSSQGSFLKFKLKDFFQSQQVLNFEFVEQKAQAIKAYEKQRILVQAFKASEDEHDIKKAVKLTEGFSSPAVLLYRASLYYQMEQWPEVRNVLKEFFETENEKPKSLRESAQALMILSLHRQGLEAEAKKLALDYLQEPRWLQDHWFNIIKKIAFNEGLESSDQEIWFDSFSGNIDSPPSNLILLSDPWE